MLSMVLSHTHKLRLTNIIQHAQSVRKGTKKSSIVVDMPKGTYKNKKLSKKMQNILRATKCDAVKIESNKKNFKIIRELVKSNIGDI